ncbi:MAG: DUF421 domain-containing protein [Candidatus Onthomonas sp.]|nr:DUF421 domain-containing protein [Candidatus Onthomonas sp.]
MAIAFARTVILYALIIVGIRLMGKKQVGELEPTELVFAMLISDLAAVPMQDFGIPLLFGLIPIVTLLAITMALSVLSLKSIRFRNLICGRPSVIMEHGSILQNALAKNRFTVDELLEELRLQGITDLSTVKYAILENSGRVSVILYEAYQPATPDQLDLTPEEEGLPLIIISDGRVLRQNLQLRNLDQHWLQQQLAEHGHTSPTQVFLLTVDEVGRIYYVPKERGQS